MTSAGINAIRTYDRAAGLVPRPRRRARHARDGRPAVGAARRLPRRPRHRRGRSSAACATRRARCAGPPRAARLRGRQRDPGADRALARPPRASSASSRGSAATVKDEDPEGLVTYVNFPTTEYLQLAVRSTSRASTSTSSASADLEAYLARLHSLAGDRPLVLAEIGLDSRRNGEQAQAARARAAAASIAFASGCAGAFVFAWTDEWHRGGHDVDDWDFGLVDRAAPPEARARRRAPRVRSASAATPTRGAWPRVSVVVCTHNGERWLPGCLDALARARLPGLRGRSSSTTARPTRSAAIARRARACASSTARRTSGCRRARNLGLEAATGEIVAYLDDDARPDPHWLRHLALRVRCAGRSRPSAARTCRRPRTASSRAASPTHPAARSTCCSTTTVAEHIPGCNMAVRRDCARRARRLRPALPRSPATTSTSAGACRSAGWHDRLQPRRPSSGTTAATPCAPTCASSATTGARRRCSSASGPSATTSPATCAGRGASTAAAPARGRRGRARGCATGPGARGLFQSIYQPADGALASLLLMPEWLLVLAALRRARRARRCSGRRCSPRSRARRRAGLRPGRAARSAGARSDHWRGAPARTRAAARVAHVRGAARSLQPLVRLAGPPARAACRPGGAAAPRALRVPRRATRTAWSERGGARRRAWLGLASSGGCAATAPPSCAAASSTAGTSHVRGGPFGGARLLCAVEEHGDGRQLARFRVAPRGLARRARGRRRPRARSPRPARARRGRRRRPRASARLAAALAVTAAYDCAGRGRLRRPARCADPVAAGGAAGARRRPRAAPGPHAAAHPRPRGRAARRARRRAGGGRDEEGLRPLAHAAAGPALPAAVPQADR